MVFKLIRLPFTILKWVVVGLVLFVVVKRFPNWARELDIANVVEVLQGGVKWLDQWLVEQMPNFN